jgi:hypothetical protein
LLGLEACAGSHFIGTALRAQGHQVRLIPAQFVKPYRKTNKNDFIDAEAIAEAVTRQNLRFVQIKSQEQLDIQARHRVRDRLVQRRTALINEIRGFLLDRGLTCAARPIHLRKNLPSVIEDGLLPRTGLRSLAGRRAAAVLHREAEAVRHEQAGQPFGPWVHRLAQRAPHNKVVVAIANKLARIAWAVLSSGRDYQHQRLQSVAAGWRWNGRCAGKAQNAFHFSIAATAEFEEDSTKGLLRREADERTVQRRVGKPAGENAFPVTEGFIRTDTCASSSRARRAILHEEAGYIYAGLSFRTSSNLLQLDGGPYSFASWSVVSDRSNSF